MVYNHEPRERIVHFSDGNSFTVPADTLMAFRDDQTGITDTENPMASLQIAQQGNGLMLRGIPSTEEVRLTLTDIQGRTVLQRSLDRQTSQFIPLETSSRGVFIVRITGNNINRTQRLVLY